jgi:hypothetical protein
MRGDNFAVYKTRRLDPLPDVSEIFQSNGLLSRKHLRLILAHFLVSASVTSTFDSLTLGRFKAKNFLNVPYGHILSKLLRNVP